MFLRVFASFCRYNLKKLTYEDRKAKFISRVAALNSTIDNDEDDEWKFIADVVSWLHK